MHTARQVDVSDVEVSLEGAPAARDDIRPGRNAWVRLGIVIDRPFGALGANALIQLAITAFYDARSGRRDGCPTKATPMSELAVYPEIYLFHVGGPHGFYAAYDFWPARKEVFLQGEPRVVLDAINDRAITRLLVPDVPPQPVEHEDKEPAAARNRITSAFAYAPDATTEGADVEIRTVKGVTQANAQGVLTGSQQSGNLQARLVQLQDIAHDPDQVARHYVSHSAERGAEAGEHLDGDRNVRAGLGQSGQVVETYSRLSVDAALRRLIGVWETSALVADVAVQ